MTPDERARIRAGRDENARRLAALDALVEAERAERFCLFCGEPMPEGRVGGGPYAAVYCSTSHRQRAYRRRRGLVAV